MNRRNFVKKQLAAATAMAAMGPLGLGAMEMQNDSWGSSSSFSDKPFKLKYAPHLGMFSASGGDDPLDQLKFMADQGFRAFEDNNMKHREVSLQEKIASTMQKLNMEMGVFVAHEISWSKPNLTNGDQALRDKFLSEIKESVEVAKRVNAKWVTVVPGFVDLRLDRSFQTANVVESLKRAAAILEPHGIVMVLEPLNFRDHPGLFLAESPQAYQVCKAVDSPSCKILFDVYHQQIQEGNLIPNIENTWEEIGYFQVGDNPGRNEPTTGEINYKNIFKLIHDKGFDGVVGMEHGKSNRGRQGELDVINAYRESDNF